MVLREILRALAAFFEALLNLFGMSSSPSDGSIMGGGPNSLRVFIKYSGKTITADLDPSWTVRKVKEVIAPKLGVTRDEIKIIFAGNELPDSFVLETSDVGQQSYLHAVRVRLELQNNPPTELLKTEMEGEASGGKEETLEQEQAENLVVQSSTRTFVTNAVVGGDSTELGEASSPIPPNSRSDFFVYCGTCDDLKEGKLRVRCGTCFSGAFTVSRHPQNWDDVLTPKQIPGTCEASSCPSTFASFYFKCSGHITSSEDDSSPPLPQIHRNPLSIPCLACGDPLDPSFYFSCPSAHSTCLPCFKSYALFKLSQRDFLQDPVLGYTLGCPALCPDSLIRDPHHFKLLGRPQYDRYQRFATEECLLQLGGIFCPQPDCGMGIIPEDAGCPKIACLHGCGYVFCRRCLEGWHLGPCRDPQATQDPSCAPSTSFFMNVDAQAKWTDANKRALRLSTKPCPSCRVPTERAGGCMHMECTKCKFQWCWVCQTKWNRECMGNHWFG